MKRVWIVDCAIATGLGSSLAINWQRLQAGDSAIGPIRHFDTSAIEFRLASTVTDLWLHEYHNRTIELTKRSAEQLTSIPKNTFIIWTGSKGDVEYIESPQDHVQAVLSSDYRKWLAHFYNIANRGIEVNAACASSTVGIALGAQMISEGECTSVLVCAADIVSRFVQMGFSALKGLTPTACRPFDRDRNGLALGDGSAALLLTDEETALAHGFTRLAAITGWGISNDANHITGPARDGSGLTEAICNALKMAHVRSEQIEAFCAHGTGTVYNDGMELAAVDKVFGDRLLPIFSIKGAIGHTLGAAGGIEIAICVKALHEKMIPPTVGLVRPDILAEGRVSDVPQKIVGKNILTSNSGFGGTNAVILLEI